MSISNHFLVNPEDGTINLHYESLNPAQVASLIRKLEANLMILKLREVDPIEVLQQSVRLDRAKNEITFYLNWNAPQMVINLDDYEEGCAVIPTPNVVLNEEQKVKYFETLTRMIFSVN